MEEIVKRLSDIEETAAQVVLNAENEKENLKAEMLKKRKALDEKFEEETAKQVAQLKKQLDERKEKEVEKLQEQGKVFLENLQKEYDELHEEYAQKVFEKVIEVK